MKSEIQKLVELYFQEEPFFIVGVSGGPDSMALLYLLHKIGLKALVVHVNYQKREKESDLDQELVEQLAFSWGYECISVRVNPKDAEGHNFQNWAREQRYTIFRDLKNEYKADAIVTAHHQDDQVETILQKVLRGSSPTVWQGMREWNDEIFRPLLTFSKQQIIDYCKKEAVPYRIDESNLEVDFARNFMRHEISEKMDMFFPGWKQNILALQEQGEIVKESLQFIADKIRNENSVDLQQFGELSVKLKSAVLKQIIDDLGFNVSSKGQLHELVKVEELQTGKSIIIEPLIFTRNRDEIQIHQQNEQVEITHTIPKLETEQGLSNSGITFIRQTQKPAGDLYVDFNKLRWPLTLRNWENGDIFKPLGMAGSQKVAHHLTNRKISSHLKEKALVLCGSDGTIYAIIYPEPAGNAERGAIAELAKCGDSTTNYLTIKIK